jgi:hypothetical protein
MNTALAEQWSDALLFAALPAEPAPDKLAIVDEVVTPEQFFTPAERSRIAWTPERRLLLAVLEDGSLCFSATAPISRHAGSDCFVKPKPGLLRQTGLRWAPLNSFVITSIWMPTTCEGAYGDFQRHPQRR